MAAGRPTLYTPELIAKANEYLSIFQTEYKHPIPSHVGLCEVLNISKTTLYRWAKENPEEFKDILDCCNAKQELTLLHGGLDGTFNPQITKLALGMQGYHDKQDQELSGPDGGPFVVQAIERTITRPD